MSGTGEEENNRLCFVELTDAKGGNVHFQKLKKKPENNLKWDIYQNCRCTNPSRNALLNSLECRFYKTCPQDSVNKSEKVFVWRYKLAKTRVVTKVKQGIEQAGCYKWPNVNGRPF